MIRRIGALIGLVMQLWLAPQLIAQVSRSIGSGSGSASAKTQVQLGISVSPETVTVGQHFVVTVHIRAPLGSVIQFPQSTTAQATVDTAATPLRRDSTSDTYLDAVTAYVLAAWDTGAHPLGLPDATVELSTETRSVPLSGVSIFVKSVLPADTALRKPKPPRAATVVHVFNWLPWIIAALIAAILLLAWWFARRWSRNRKETPVASLTWAEREFQRIEGLHLIEQGEFAQYAILMIGVTRTYLAREFPQARMSETTRELSVSLHDVPVIPLDQTLELFERTDLLKFAHAPILADQARHLGDESRALVQHIDAQIQAARAAAAAEAQANTAPRSGPPSVDTAEARAA